MLDALVRSEGEPDLVQILGGEPPAIRRSFQVLAAARPASINHVILNPNCIRIASIGLFDACLSYCGFGSTLRSFARRRSAQNILVGALPNSAGGPIFEARNFRRPLCVR